MTNRNWAKWIIMVSVIAAGQLGQATQAQEMPSETPTKPAQAPSTPWAWQASLSVTEQYNDNVFQSSGPNDPSTPEKSDMITIIAPALKIARKSELLLFDFSYQPSFNLYAHYHDELNYIGQAGHITLSVPKLGPGLLQHTKLDLSDGAVYTEENLYSFPSLPDSGQITGNGGIITQRSKSWNNSATASLTQQLTTTLQGIARYESFIYRYENPDLTDTDENSVSLGISDRWTQRTTLNAIYSYTNFIYDTPNTERQVTNTVSVGIDQVVNPTLQAHLTVGDSFLSTNNRHYPTGSASITKHFHYTTATVSYTNQISAGGGISNVPTINQSGNMIITRSLGPHAHARASGSVADQRSTTSPTAVTHSFTVTASADYEVTKWLRASVAYRHSAQKGNNNTTTITTAGQDVRWNTIGLTLDGTWETPIQ